MKRTAVMFLALLVLFSFSGCGGNSNSKNEAVVEQAQTELQQSLENVKELQKGLVNNSEPAQEIEEPSFNIDSVEWIDTSLEDILTLADANPLKAEMTYLNQYVKCTGYLQHYIYKDSFTICYDTDLFASSMGKNVDITCANKTENLFTKEYIEQHEYEPITIWGQITELDGVADGEYDYIDVYKAEIIETPIPALEDFVSVTPDDLIDAYDKSIEAAKDEYMGAFIKFSGEIDSIESDHLNIYNPYITTSRGGRIECYYSSDENKLVVAEKSKGDTATIWGKVRNINEALYVCYYVDIIDIQ